MDLSSKIHALLFAEGDSLTKKKLCATLSCDAATLEQAIASLDERLTSSPIRLVRTDTEVALAVAPDMQDTIVSAQLKEQAKEIGDAGLEVLTIVLYEGPSTRADIDYIRGVNSSSTLRTLLSRGLVERSGNPEDGREYIYRPTVELLAHVGVSNTKELPNYSSIVEELRTYQQQRDIFAAEPLKVTA